MNSIRALLLLGPLIGCVAINAWHFDEETWSTFVSTARGVCPSTHAVLPGCPWEQRDVGDWGLSFLRVGPWLVVMPSRNDRRADGVTFYVGSVSLLRLAWCIEQSWSTACHYSDGFPQWQSSYCQEETDPLKTPLYYLLNIKNFKLVLWFQATNHIRK